MQDIHNTEIKPRILGVKIWKERNLWPEKPESMEGNGLKSWGNLGMWDKGLVHVSFQNHPKFPTTLTISRTTYTQSLCTANQKFNKERKTVYRISRYKVLEMDKVMELGESLRDQLSSTLSADFVDVVEDDKNNYVTVARYPDLDTMEKATHLLQQSFDNLIGWLKKK